MKKALTYTLAVLAIVAVCVVLFSLLGAAFFLLPLLGGAFAKKITKKTRYGKDSYNNRYGQGKPS